MELAGYIAMLFVGGALGLIGGGGAILTVPIMVYLFKAPALMATSYSLFVVGVSSLFGVLQYHQRNLVDYRTAVTFALPSFLGTYLARRLLLPALPDAILQIDSFTLNKDQFILIIFALVMLGASLSMIRGGNCASDKGQPTQRNITLLATLGIIVGFVAGLVGAGGGFLIIPALVIFANMPMKTAIGTSLLVISANSLAGFGGDVLAGGAVAWGFLLGATTMALIGIFLGTRAARYVPSSKLKPAFGWFVLAMGIYIAFTQLHR